MEVCDAGKKIRFKKEGHLSYYQIKIRKASVLKKQWSGDCICLKQIEIEL